MVRRRRKNKVGSVRTFLDILEKLNPSTDEVLYFRGHSNSTHLLTPSIYRLPNWIKNEDILYKEMILRCPNDFREQENTFQMLVKMQHYSLPTRLFDITANPLIGLYFACLKGKKRAGTDGEVVVFKIPKRDVRYFDSDTVSVISNISRRPHTFTVPPAADIEEFNKTEEIGFLLHEIKKEKPYFEPKIKRGHLESVVCVKPKLDNPRVIRQDGAFLLFGVSGNKSEPASVPTRYIHSDPKIIINKLEKKKILEQLKALGITQSTIYPEIDKVAEHLKEIYGS